MVAGINIPEWVYFFILFVVLNGAISTFNKLKKDQK